MGYNVATRLDCIEHSLERIIIPTMENMNLSFTVALSGVSRFDYYKFTVYGKQTLVT